GRAGRRASVRRAGFPASVRGASPTATRLLLLVRIGRFLPSGPGIEGRRPFAGDGVSRRENACGEIVSSPADGGSHLAAPGYAGFGPTLRPGGPDGSSWGGVIRCCSRARERLDSLRTVAAPCPSCSAISGVVRPKK